MSTVVLNVKIEETLKDKLRQYAEANNDNLSTATEKLLLSAFELTYDAEVSEDEIDNQHIEEDTRPFTPKEIKALRKILKKRK